MNATFLSDAVSSLVPSVVQVVNGEGRHGAQGMGAGVAWRSSGLIVTNAHVATEQKVTLVTHDRTATGDVVARDDERDLAIIRPHGLTLPGPRVNGAEHMRPGALVVAVGHPFGAYDAVSTGVFQAVGRLPPAFPLKKKLDYDWVQADVRLAPGNSGGPLADALGQVIGIAAMVVAGLALAIPARDVDRMVRALA
ncbi:MAG TPA: S1C family serine protease [Gemmatimonadales bacterium]|jgi:serine protease Do